MILSVPHAGVILYADPNFGGEGVFFSLGRHTNVYGLQDQASSLLITKPGDTN